MKAVVENLLFTGLVIAFFGLPSRSLLAVEQNKGALQNAVQRFDTGEFGRSGHDRGSATPAGELRLADGFRAELLYSVPTTRQGSWVCLAMGPKGRLIASAQRSGLFRITLPPIGSAQHVQVERLNAKLKGAQGLLYAFGSLYAVVNADDSALYRLRDTNGDDQFDEVKRLCRFEGGGEHGPHAVVLGPDRKSLRIPLCQVATFTCDCAHAHHRSQGECTLPLFSLSRIRGAALAPGPL